ITKCKKNHLNYNLGMAMQISDQPNEGPIKCTKNNINAAEVLGNRPPMLAKDDMHNEVFSRLFHATEDSPEVPAKIIILKKCRSHRGVTNKVITQYFRDVRQTYFVSLVNSPLHDGETFEDKDHAEEFGSQLQSTSSTYKPTNTTQNFLKHQKQECGYYSKITDCQSDWTVGESEGYELMVLRARETVGGPVCATIWDTVALTARELALFPNADSGTDAEPLEQTEFERYKAFNDRTVDYDQLERKLNETLGLLAQKDIDIQEVVESLKMNLNDLESDIKQGNFHKHDEITELQCLYLHKVMECDCLAQKLSEQTDFVSKEIYTELLQRFARLEKHSISLEIALQECQVQLKNDTVCKERASNVFRKEPILGYVRFGKLITLLQFLVMEIWLGNIDVSKEIYYGRREEYGLTSREVKDQFASSCDSELKQKRSSFNVKDVSKFKRSVEFASHGLCWSNEGFASINGRGIEHQTSTLEHLEQNAVCRKRNRTLVVAAETMLLLSTSFILLGCEAIATL
ncbi:hypothetical protein Tco_1246328, partial [Tanacetum coccineum]